MKTYDLSQPLNEQAPFWPYYPPFEVKYIKRKAEHGVNAQYIQTSNHMGTHLDAPRHFVTKGMTIDQIPVEWLCGPGVIVNLALFFAWHVFWPQGWASGSPGGGLDFPSLAIGLAATAALFRFKANVILVIAACGAAGLAAALALP